MNYWLFVLWTLVLILVASLKLKFSYWQLKGVPQLKTHFIFGHFFKLKSLNHLEILQEVYDRFKSSAKLAGIYLFTKPVAIVLDLDVVKSVLIKDFNNFEDRMEYKNEKDILSAHLFNVQGTVWRPLRQKLTPTFTTGKMKFMFPTIAKLTHELKEAYERQAKESCNGVVDVYRLNGRYTTDVVSSCIFGAECNSLRDPSEPFWHICSKIFGRTNFNVRWHLFKQTYVDFMKFFGHKRYPQFIESFFRRITRDAVLEREKQGIQRNDFMNILIELKNKKDDKGQPMLTYDQVSAQLFVFFAAGFETSSTNMSMVLYELARHPDIQEKARQEIQQILEKYDDQLSYEAIMEMVYLDQIITETLRLYPASGFLQRMAVNDYPVPGTNVIIDKGTVVLIPISAIHHDPEIYENPLEFKPERFSPSQVVLRHPQSFLAFGDGPRNCIGLRFGRMQVLIGLVTLLKNFRFSVCPETSKNVKFSNHSLANTPVNGVKLKVENC